MGTGTAGEDHPNRLEFDFAPQFLAIVTNEESTRPHGSSGGMAPWIYIRPWTRTNRLYSGNTSAYSYSTHVTWLENGVSWYAQYGDGTVSAANQLNKEGTTYYYIAIG